MCKQGDCVKIKINMYIKGCLDVLFIVASCFDKEIEELG
jgi:hypothetical protein